MVFWFSMLSAALVWAGAGETSAPARKPALAAPAYAIDESLEGYDRGSERLVSYCDLAEPLKPEERRALLNRLRLSKTGAQVLRDFLRQYGSFKNLLIQWDSVSYSQVSGSGAKRAPAGLTPATDGKSALGDGVCVHLTRKLPEIEHVADLVHELTHATRLELRVLKGEVDDTDEFVKLRLTASGGEADAFSVECRAKRELLGRWDTLCAPYATIDDSKTAAADGSSDTFDVKRVVHDLYNGQLSASLTGEAYPVMLGRQYEALRVRKVRQSHNSREISAVENKRGIQ